MVNYIFTGLTIFLVLSLFMTAIPLGNFYIRAQAGTFPESLFAGTNQAQLSELNLKTFQQNSNTNQEPEFNVDFSNVITNPPNSQFAVFTTDNSLSIIGANIKSTSSNVIDLIKSDANTFSLDGISSGVYTLEVITQKESEMATYEGILVIGQATNQEIQQQIVKITTDVDIVFKKPTLVNDPCNYHGQNICDKSGECDSEKFDCWSDCSDGSIQTTGQCAGDDRPLRTIAASGEDTDESLPPCDGSYQDCETDSGFECEAESTDDNCETSEEDNVEGESSNGEETSQEESEGDTGGGDDSGDTGGGDDSGGDDSGDTGGGDDSGGDDSGDTGGGDDSGGDDN